VKLPEVIYYENELEDEFSTAVITPKKIDETFDYEGGFWRRLGRALLYHLLAKPLAWLFLKLRFGHRVVGAEKLKAARGQGYFLYGNHTNAAADALIPTILQFWGSTYVIVHPNNVSMPVFGHITPALGAIPLPDTTGAMKHFLECVKNHIQKGRVITIYPEAHIWPYYTKIRPFKNDAFAYPVQLHTPVYCFTNTYQKRSFFKTPRIVTYVEGPFYPDNTQKKPLQREDLRNQVYTAMCQNAAHNTIQRIRYINANERTI
jgi:1-acyl-sn-glycerol-3-phosphate acyltransferase